MKKDAKTYGEESRMHELGKEIRRWLLNVTEGNGVNTSKPRFLSWGRLRNFKDSGSVEEMILNLCMLIGLVNSAKASTKPNLMKKLLHLCCTFTNTS